MMQKRYLIYIGFILIIVIILSVVQINNPFLVESENIIEAESPEIAIDSSDNPQICWISVGEKSVEDILWLTTISDSTINTKKIIARESIFSNTIQIFDGRKKVIKWSENEDVNISGRNLRGQDYYTILDGGGKPIVEQKSIFTDFSRKQDERKYINIPKSDVYIADNNNIFVIWLDSSHEQWTKLADREKYPIHRDLYFMIIDIESNIKHWEQLTTSPDKGEDSIHLCMDINNDLWVSWELEDIYQVMELSFNGTLLINITPLKNIAVTSDLPVITGHNGSFLYLGDNGIVDLNNNIHIISSSDSCSDKSANLLYTKLNRTGTKLIENLTIATHDKKKNYDHGPAIFDPKVAIDSEDNIHITWYINDGGNHFSIYYMKIDPNGTVLIPAMKIAPEDEKGKDSKTPAFELIPLIMVVVVAAAVMRRRR